MIYFLGDGRQASHGRINRRPKADTLSLPIIKNRPRFLMIALVLPLAITGSFLLGRTETSYGAELTIFLAGTHFETEGEQ